MTLSTPIVQKQRFVAASGEKIEMREKAAGLSCGVLATWGPENNARESARWQLERGVDIIISDHILTPAKTLDA